MLRTSFCILLSLIAFSCGNKGETPATKANDTKIVVGMTYEEVEKVLGKPVSITRGFSELANDIESLEPDKLERLAIDKAFAGKPGWLATPQKIEVKGQLLYVTWTFNETRTDSGFVLYYLVAPRPTSYRERTDPKTRVYVTQFGSFYHRFPGCPNITGIPHAITLGDLPDDMIGCSACNPPSRWVERTRPPRPPGGDRLIPEWFNIVYARSVIFDAASGRVANEKYLPITITPRR